jgi:7,8-dihydro-6-hydroxymethylpterin-pyrophosphokinase
MSTAMSEGTRSIQEQIVEVQQRLSNARARIPKHTPPPSLMIEIDELEEELARLEGLVRPKTVDEQIVEVQQRLSNARARIPKHTPPPALMVEIDELEEELERLQSLKGA